MTKSIAEVGDLILGDWEIRDPLIVVKVTETHIYWQYYKTFCEDKEYIHHFRNTSDLDKMICKCSQT